jgi:hypothetical protein
MIEVSPDVVLFVYGAWGPPNTPGPAQLRRQFLAVRPDGLVPARSEWAGLGGIVSLHNFCVTVQPRPTDLLTRP